MENKVRYLELLRARERLLARDEYFRFVKWMSPKSRKWNWHHRYVCNVLQNWYMTDMYPFLMLFEPPQHQKTTCMTEFLPAWGFGKNPNDQMILTMYNATQAKKYNRKIKKIMLTPEYKRIFPNTRINEPGHKQEGYINTHEQFDILGGEGFFMAVGVDGGIAGNPAKKLLMDDVIKNVEEANSETYRNRTYDWYTDEAEARLHNDSKVAFTITRRHQEDLAGRLIKRDGTTDEGGKWKVITLEAIRENMDNPDDPRAYGEALFPELHSLERLLEIKDKNPRTFTSLYQQKPVIEGGNMLKKEWFPIITEAELPFNIKDVVVNFWIDGAFTDNVKNDESALMAEVFWLGKLYILNCTGVRKEMYEFLKFFRDYTDIHHHSAQSKVNIELKASGYDMKSMLRKREFGDYNAIGIDSKTVSIGKYSRVQNSEPFCQSGKVILVKGNWNQRFLDQISAFPNAPNDDMTDLLGYSVSEYFVKSEKARGKVGFGG